MADHPTHAGTAAEAGTETRVVSGGKAGERGVGCSGELYGVLVLVNVVQDELPQVDGLTLLPGQVDRPFESRKLCLGGQQAISRRDPSVTSDQLEAFSE